MKRVTEKRTSPLRLAVLALAVGALTGCEDGASNALTQPGEQDAAPATKTTSKAKQRDVEAPEVFEATEAGLWDGRPSLGGIWVAHPDVTQPERVKIVNTANNKSTVGALFRRERALPGPIVQVSSDAAAKLGMLAGAPTELHIVALRREVTEEPSKAKPAEQKEPAEPTNKTDDKAQKPKEPKPDPTEPVETKKEPPAAAAGQKAANSTDTAENGTEPPKKRWWQRRKKSDTITETKLAPIAGAAVAIDASEASSKPQAAAASPQSSGGSSIAKPYVQIGTFTVKENAETAAEKARKGGLNAEVRSASKDDKTIWRVVVGPAKSRTQRKEIIAQAEGLGFADAYVVKN